AKGTFFNYFPTKELLLADIVEFRLEIFRAALVEAERGGAPLRQILHELLYALMSEPGRSPAMARCMIMAPLAGGPVETLAHEIMAKGRQVLSAAIEIGQQRGERS